MTVSTGMKRVLVALCVLALILPASVGVAQSYDPDQDIPQPTGTQKRVDKFGRGLTNILFGWAEIPKAWHQGVQTQKPLTWIIGTGTVRGVTKFVVRTGGGVYELFTFPVDTANNQFDPILEPEYLF